MPFENEKQRRFMWAKHPDIARRWTDKYGSTPKKDVKMASAKGITKRATRIMKKTGASSHEAFGLAVKRAKAYQGREVAEERAGVRGVKKMAKKQYERVTGKGK